MGSMWRWSRLRGWWLVVGAAIVVALVSAASRALPAVAASLVVAVTSAVAGVLSSRGTKTLAEDVERSRRIGDELLVDDRGRLPRVRDIVDPVMVGVHRATALTVGDSTSAHMPPFVRRDCSAELEDAIRSGGFVLVIGESTAGKSRAAFEAIRACLADHTLVRPADRAAMRAALTAVERERRCVVWLDDLERYLGSGGFTAHLLARMLADDKRHVVVLATMRTQERARYSARSAARAGAGTDELARLGRETLDLAVQIRIDRRWTPAELDRAQRFADDNRIAVALKHTGRFGLAEYLAAGPQLLVEWHDGWAPGTHPRGAALIAAAVDARRVGYHHPLPVDVLRELHEHYLHQRGGAKLRPESWEDALGWAVEPVHATTSLLIPDEQQRYLAFDYLADAVDSDTASAPVPDVAWETMISIADPVSTTDIGWNAYSRKYEDHARAAFRKALDDGHVVAAIGMAQCLGQDLNHWQAAEVLRAAIVSADAQNSSEVDPADLLDLRDRLAWYTGLTGNVTEALQLTLNLVAQSTKLLGPEHPYSLWHRLQLARWEGKAGNAQLALQLAQEVSADFRRILGEDHPGALSSRFELAIWTGHSGDAAGAVQLLQALDITCTRICRDDDTLLLDTRLNLACWMCQTGDVINSVRLYKRVVEDSARIFGDTHPRTIWARLGLTHATGSSGKPVAALQMAKAIATDCATSLGDDHEITLNSRYTVAAWTGESGDIDNTIKQLEALVLDAAQLLGPAHEITLDSRSRLAHWTGERGEAARAVQLYEDVLADRSRVQGPDHSDTRNDREELERWRHAAVHISRQ
jgi:eukaryotic-like serine/threonine-protein kinase